MNTHTHIGKFTGFPPEPTTNYWQYPKALNGWWKALTPWEQKVLDYLLRHTWGYKKTKDAISLSQFMYGITKRDGTQHDGGTGIKDKRTIRKALRGLEEKGFIIRTDIIGKESIFALRIDPSQTMLPPTSHDTPLPTSDVGSNPSQEMIPTIKNYPIKNNNTFQKDNKSKEIKDLVAYLSKKLGDVTYPNYGKQAKYAKAILTGYSFEDAIWAIDKMYENQWWRENSFDMKNVADEIPKLMTKTYKNDK
jgi:hypothetical protein